MNQGIAGRILALAALMTATSACAGAAGDLRGCRAVTDNLQRLACYDALADAAPADNKDATPAPAVAAPASAPAPGAITQEPSLPDLIEAHLTGDLKGWKLGTEFHLDNGQVWRVTQPGEIRTELLSQPAVTLKKSWIGYWISIEGVHAKTKVTRIE